jgi:hypothetical protein
MRRGLLDAEGDGRRMKIEMFANDALAHFEGRDANGRI